MITKKEEKVLILKKKGLTQVEISKKLKITQPAVSKFYNNALKKIKDAKETIKKAKEIGFLILLITIATIIIINNAKITLAENNPGHDSLYIEQNGDSELTGSLNITGFLGLFKKLFWSGLELQGNGSQPSTTGTAQAYVLPTNDLVINSPTTLYLLKDSGSEVKLGNGVVLNVTNDIYSYGTIYQQGVKVCLSNGTNCINGNNTGNVSSVTGGDGITTTGTKNVIVNIDTTDISTCTGSNQKIIWDSVNKRLVCSTDLNGGSSGGWTNSSTTTSTDLNVNITQGNLTIKGRVGINNNNPSYALDVSGDGIIRNTLKVGTTYNSAILNIMGDNSINNILTIQDSNTDEIFNIKGSLIAGDYEIKGGDAGGYGGGYFSFNKTGFLFLKNKLGINTTNPTTSLQIGDNNHQGTFQIYIPNTLTGHTFEVYDYFGDPLITARGSISGTNYEVGLGDADDAEGGAYININKTRILVQKDIIPAVNNSFSLGSPTKVWKDLYLSNGSLYIGGKKLSIDNNGNLLWDNSIVFTENNNQGGDITSISIGTNNCTIGNCQLTTMDGSGSGLDADLLDGIDSSGFVRSNVADTITGTITFNAIPAFNGGTSGSTAPFTVDSNTKVTNLNADLLDGYDSSQFMLATTDNWVNTAGDTMTGTLNMNNNIITNIGNTATNFTSTGGLNLADDIRVGGNDIKDSSGTARITFSGGDVIIKLG